MSRHYAASKNAEELMRMLDADEERQREALRKFYARNAAPHYSKVKVNLWGLFIAGAVAAYAVWWVIKMAIDGTLGAFGQ